MEKVEKETIITLDDNTKYALLDETEADNRKFYFAVKLDNATLNPTTEYEVFEEEIEDNVTYMTPLEEGNDKQAILLDFVNNYMHIVGEMMAMIELLAYSMRLLRGSATELCAK